MKSFWSPWNGAQTHTVLPLREVSTFSLSEMVVQSLGENKERPYYHICLIQRVDVYVILGAF